MNYAIIIRPLIGAGIGYVTNWIAVKMMFRPLNTWHIGKLKIPFTPGIIPKNKERIAESIGNTISKSLLTEETLRLSLLSDDVKLKIKNNLITFFNNSSAETSTTIRDLICSYIDNNTYETSIINITNYVSNSIYETVKKSNIGDIVAEQIEISAKEKIKGSFLGVLGGNAIISSISENASLKINDYIDKNGQNLINSMVSTEISKYTSYTVSDIYKNISNSNIDITNIIMDIYEKFILNKLSDLLKTINITKIVSDKINSMDTLELEKIILTIMKKELNALVNLGALIGFILGLLNLLF